MCQPAPAGLTSLVIDRSGGPDRDLGHGVPASGEAVYSVRQNLPRWCCTQATKAAATEPMGAPPRRRAYVARSALGQDAAATWCTPAACPRPGRPGERAGLRGRQIAMELDINPSGCSWTWQTARAALHPRSTPEPAGESVSARLGQGFITVLARPRRRVRPGPFGINGAERGLVHDPRRPPG